MSANSSSAKSPIPKLLSIVIPLYNEEAMVSALEIRLESVSKKLPCPVEWIIVSDGSTDKTMEKLANWAKKDKKVKVIEFTRNFGHQFALTAGLDHASGDIIGMMDGDLQDPPELIPKMLQKCQEGFDIVYTQKLERGGEGAFKKITADLFYSLFDRFASFKIIRNSSDFRLMSRNALDAFLSLREHDRFIRGMIPWLGFKSTVVRFDRPKRLAGKSKFSPIKMLRLALSGFKAFSELPFQIIYALGVCSLFIGIGVLIFSAYIFIDSASGSAPTVQLLLLFTSGWLSLGIGSILTFLSIYLKIILGESRTRPLYVIRNTINLKSSSISRINPMYAADNFNSTESGQ